MKLTDPVPDFVSKDDAYNYIVAREQYHVALNNYKDDGSPENHQRMLDLFAKWEATDQKPKR